MNIPGAGATKNRLQNTDRDAESEPDHFTRAAEIYSQSDSESEPSKIDGFPSLPWTSLTSHGFTSLPWSRCCIILPKKKTVRAGVLLGVGDEQLNCRAGELPEALPRKPLLKKKILATSGFSPPITTP